MSRYYDFYYTPSTPKEVKGGIKAQSKSGSFTKNWWGKKWIQTLESFNIGARLSRGRSYARRGQVAELNIVKGKITAKVQGSRAQKYKVIIKMSVLKKAEWKKIIDKLSEQPIYVAQLLNNEMPEDIERYFLDINLNLFPKKQEDLETDCSCPDWSNPCKHIAAVFYLIAEAFDSDPFLLFKLRGMERDELLKLLSEKSNLDKENKDLHEYKKEQLSSDTDKFWGTYKNYKIQDEFYLPKINAAIPKRLGKLSFWRSNKDFIEEMESVYKNTSKYAYDSYFNKVVE